MKQFFTILLSIMAFVSFGQVQVTFLVDMSGQTVSSDGVHIVGSLNGWTTDANKMEDQGNNIYGITLDLQPGQDFEYKYLNGNAWGTEEAAPGTCTIGGNKRTFTTPTSDVTMSVTPFNSCPSNNPTQNVTFRVDMTGQIVSNEGVHVAGNFQAWNPGATLMNNVGSNIYEVTVPVLSSLGVLQYKFVNGNAWGSEETPAQGCGNESGNRPFVIKGAGANVELPTASFGGCSNPVSTRSVVFTANLGSSEPAAEGVHVAGSFQGWNPEGTTMTEVSPGFYQVEVEILSTSSYIEYKYLNGNAWGTDETVPASCSYNNNRYQIFDLENQGQLILPNYEFGTCNSASVSTNEIDYSKSFDVYPTIADEELLVTLLMNNSTEATLSAYGLNGELMYSKVIDNSVANDATRISVNDWPTGMYVIQLNSKDRMYSQKVVVR